MSKGLQQLGCPIGLLVLALLTACGGSGGGSGGDVVTEPPPPALTITNDSILPGTLQNRPYSVTLHAANGVGALKWSIAPISSTTLFVDGLTIDPSTGVLSGTATFAGTAGFVATVKDSSSQPRTTTKTFSITASGPLQAPAPQTYTVGEFQDVIAIGINAIEGVQPLIFAVTGGSLPDGLRLNSQSGIIAGGATALGIFVATITIRDSYSPPEVVTTQVTFQVNPAPLSVAPSIPQQMLLNRPFSGRVIAIGGTPPYHFVKTSGALPPGLSAIDPSSGQFNGTPTTPGGYSFDVSVTDSSDVAQSALGSFSVNVTNPLGRNDSIATATPLDNAGISGSISPYIDPPDGAPLAADNDYYKVVSLSGSTVHLETFAERAFASATLDTVLEIVDGSGTRESTCNVPAGTNTNFSSACISDDIGGDPPILDSALDFKVPGPANTPSTFYVHVLDWRGDARPDMLYRLQVFGVVAPLSIQTTSVLPAARGLSYSQQLTAINSIGTVSWSIPSGSLPPGLTLNSSGTITGTATTDGTYSFSIKATDAGNPPQTATAPVVIKVVDPVQITSPPTWPDACVNKPYTFAVQTSGGIAPFGWSFISNNWLGLFMDQSTGVFTGTPLVTGTFHGTVGVNDATMNGVSQQVTVTVKQCP